MAIPSFSAFHDEGINLEGLLEILSPENNLVLADDMMVSDGNGIILRVSETYEKNFGFAHDSIVGKSAFDLEADGTFTPCITAEVIRRRKKISATQTINHTHKNVMTVGIPLFDANGELKYAVCFNTVSMEQINSIQRNYRRMQDSLQHYSQEIAELRTRATSTNLLFKSAPMQRLWTLMQNTANTRANILITGETGVGKSAIAKAIHNMSSRANGPFIEVNCAVLHENLIESELFGYEKGAFTGAASGGKIGKIELANHGTLFLDEIGELPHHIQSKLLQLIQEKTIERLSGTRRIELDFRLLVATNRNLEEEVQRGLFRSDLFYRLNVIRIHIPPLREREGDLLLLIDHFCRNIGASFTLSPELERLLLAHQWRGNIRELRNVVEYFSYLGHSVVGAEELPPTFRYRPAAAPPAELPALADCPREDSRFVLERLYEADQAGRSLGREAILAAAREAGLPCSQQEVRRILAGLDRAGLVRVSRGRGGTRLTPAGRALCGRPAVEGGAAMV